MFRIINSLKNRKGFTLIELIVVLAVLAIIAAIAVPRFMGIQEKAKIDADYSTGAMIAKAAELYVAQNDTTTTTIPTSNLQLSPVKFESSKIEGKTLTDVTVTQNTSSGSITVKVASTSSSSLEIYPSTTSLD